MALTEAQRAAIRLQPLSGSLGIATSWTVPLADPTISQDESIRVTRSVLPEGAIRAADTVEVTIEVDLGPAAVTGCYLVTDMAPSGLAPIRETAGWPRGRRDTVDVDSPLSISGQRVTFCVYRDEREDLAGDDGTDTTSLRTLRYQARLVTPGTYAWEPTLVQSVEAPELRRLGDGGRIILGAGMPGASTPTEAAAPPGPEASPEATSTR
jgi:uncharacterized protein YfaS (alpha-2-macroglobulin family)